MKRLIDLSEREILALAIFSEEEDSKIYRGFAEGLREQYPASGKVFDEMADEEVRHRTMLFDLYRSKFGDFLPLIRRQDQLDRRHRRRTCPLYDRQDRGCLHLAPGGTHELCLRIHFSFGWVYCEPSAEVEFSFESSGFNKADLSALEMVSAFRQNFDKFSPGV
jgi:Rubrerythrin